MLLHAFLVWRAFSRTTIPGSTIPGSTKALLHSAAEQTREVARALGAMGHSDINADELTLLTMLMHKLDDPAQVESVRRKAAEWGLNFEKLLKLARHIESLRPQVIEQRKEAARATQMSSLNDDESVLLTMIMSRLDEPQHLEALQSLAKDKGINFDRLLALAKRLNHVAPPLPYDRGKPEHSRPNNRTINDN